MQVTGIGLLCVAPVAALAGLIDLGGESAAVGRPASRPLEELFRDPCSTLSEGERTGLGVGVGQPETGVAASECLWRAVSGEGPLLTVSLGQGGRADIDRAAAAQSAPGTVPEPVPLRPYRALQAQSSSGDCVVHVELQPEVWAGSSRVTGAVAPDTCALAAQLAATVLTRVVPPG
ncbi:DUF3558 domain-containing protein [Saccharothrix sp. AJ9571]|nr:DUF3558 domain-containing protein [Saccharothrix sp. AJ9571]